MKKIDYKSYVEIAPPKEFKFEECLIFLGRSNQEVLHKVKENSVYKLLKVNDSFILFKITCSSASIVVEFPIGAETNHIRKKVATYIEEWFDLRQDLSGFYQMASQDKILKEIAQNYYGLRMICIPDLFEALVWAIIGQQINLTFAYTLKKRFVEQFGDCLTFEEETFWLFPSFDRIALLDVDDLKKLQFTGRKAEYIIGIAKAMSTGEITKELLLHKQDYEQVKKSLMSIRGIGAWSADYVMMKCLHYTSSLPIVDVGLHNALKNVLALEHKPNLEEIEDLASNWKGWQAYATFYLWRTLYDENV